MSKWELVGTLLIRVAGVVALYYIARKYGNFTALAIIVIVASGVLSVKDN